MPTAILTLSIKKTLNERNARLQFTGINDGLKHSL